MNEIVPGTERFKIGKFYQHEGGRYIAVIGKVESYAWGWMLIVEEADHTGHSISCIDRDSVLDEDKWMEVGKGEWLGNFKVSKPN